MWNEEVQVRFPRVRTRSPSPTPAPPSAHSSLSTSTFPVFHNSVYGVALESNESMPYSLSQSQNNAPGCAKRHSCCREEEEENASSLTSSSVLTLLRQFFTRGCEYRDLAPCAYAAGSQPPQQCDTAGRLLLCCLDTIGEMGTSLLQQQEKWNEAALRGQMHPTAVHFRSQQQQQQRLQQIYRVLRRAAERLALIELLLTNQKPSPCRPLNGAARHGFLPSSSSSSSAVSVMTPRDIYYRLESVFPSQAVLNRTLDTVSRLTGCSRDRFGVEAGGRGAVGGLLYLGTVDASAMGPQGLPLSGADYMTSFEEAVQESLRRETGSMESHHEGAGLSSPSASFSRIDSSVSSHAPNVGLTLDASRARYLLIIEKDAIFYRLMEQQLYRKLPVILITSAGFPTVAVRRLVHRLLMEQPSLQPYALVDYNPSGVSIMLNYMHALRAPKRSLLLPRFSSTKLSTSQMIDITNEGEGHHSTTLPPLNEDSSHSFSIPNLKWIGLRSAQIDAMTRSADASRVADVDACSPLSSRDKQMLRKLLLRTTRSDSNGPTGAHSSSSWPLPERWRAELAQMQQRDYSMEIEALDSLLLLRSPTMRLSDWVVERVLQQDAI